MADGELNDSRPLSPHIWSWKWHITMLTSILHRVTGVGLYIGSFLLVGWLLALAMGEEAYNGYSAFVGSPLGLLILFGFTLAAMYHLANGLRHLFWDAGTGYKPEVANTTGMLTIAFAIVATIGIWAYILTSVVEF